MTTNYDRASALKNNRYVCNVLVRATDIVSLVFQKKNDEIVVLHVGIREMIRLGSGRGHATQFIGVILNSTDKSMIGQTIRHACNDPEILLMTRPWGHTPKGRIPEAWYNIVGACSRKNEDLSQDLSRYKSSESIPADNSARSDDSSTNILSETEALRSRIEAIEARQDQNEKKNQEMILSMFTGMCKDFDQKYATPEQVTKMFQEHLSTVIGGFLINSVYSKSKA